MVCYGSGSGLSIRCKEAIHVRDIRQDRGASQGVCGFPN